MSLLIDDLKTQFPSLKIVKMFSDGCAAQFKNRWTLSNVMFVEKDFAVNLSWNFFAPGHGKGAVDGVGGTAKRAVYQRVLTQQTRVYSAKDFDDCMNNYISGISTQYVSTDEIKRIEIFLSPRWSKNKEINGITKYFSFTKHSENILSASVTANASPQNFRLIEVEKSLRQKRSKRKN